MVDRKDHAGCLDLGASDAGTSSMRCTTVRSRHPLSRISPTPAWSAIAAHARTFEIPGAEIHRRLGKMCMPIDQPGQGPEAGCDHLVRVSHGSAPPPLAGVICDRFTTGARSVTRRCMFRDGNGRPRPIMGRWRTKPRGSCWARRRFAPQPLHFVFDRADLVVASCDAVETGPPQPPPSSPPHSRRRRERLPRRPLTNAPCVS